MDEIIECVECGGEAVDGQHVPVDLNIRNNDHLCENCHNEKIKRAQQDQEDEERRNAKREKHR